jgi:hypothetical protein
MNKAASLKEILANAEQKKTAVVRCTTCRLLLALDKEDREALQTALFSNEWNLSVLSRILKEQGHNASHQSLQNHNRAKHQIPVE